MSKVDLIDNSWIELVFENKNKKYGAYQLRKNTGKRNVKALVIVFATIAVIIAAFYAKVAIENAMPKKVAIETDVELSKLAQKKEAKVERKEPIKVEQEQKVVEKVKSSVKFTAPEIKKDEDVNPEDELKSQDELAKTNTAIGSFDVKGNAQGGGDQGLRRGGADAPVPGRTAGALRIPLEAHQVSCDCRGERSAGTCHRDIRG